jgi:hypothetical protein
MYLGIRSSGLLKEAWLFSSEPPPLKKKNKTANILTINVPSSVHWVKYTLKALLPWTGLVLRILPPFYLHLGLF